MKKEWSATNTAKGGRTIADIVSCHQKPKSKQLGCVHPPLFNMIPIDYVIPDITHLFLRVTDVLFNLIVLDIRQDGIE